MTECGVLIVGGGAAGLFAAARMPGAGRVIVAEKMPQPGRKLLITGKGRCNLTNHCAAPEFLENVPRGAKFLHSAIAAFPPGETEAFFAAQGVKLKVERGGRVFPESDSAADVLAALQRAAGRRADIRMNCPIASLLIGEGRVQGAVTAEGEPIRARAVVVATGGLSYPGTGSTGDGYRLARQAGHTVTDTAGSLVPLVTAEREPAQMMGLSLKNVALRLIDRNTKKVLFEELGEMLMAHFGVSGPLVLSASAHIERDEPGRYALSIDLKPGLTAEQLDRRIQRDFGENLNRAFHNALGALLPRSLITVIVSRSGIDPEAQVNAVTREQRRALASLIKNYTLTVTRRRPVAEAVVTRGGVALREVNPKTMESKLLPGLYFCGEVLDADGYTGGYNLQIAFATAAAAARALGGD